MEHPGLFRKTRFQGEQSPAGAHDISVHTSVCKLSPTVCRDINRKSSLPLKDAQPRRGDRGTFGQHAALAAVGIGGGASQGCLCWGADLPLWLEWSLQGVWSLSQWHCCPQNMAAIESVLLALPCTGCRTPGKGQHPVRTLKEMLLEPVGWRRSLQTWTPWGVPKSLPGRSMCSRVCAHVCVLTGHTGLPPEHACLLNRSRQLTGTLKEDVASVKQEQAAPHKEQERALRGTMKTTVVWWKGGNLPQRRTGDEGEGEKRSETRGSH